MRRWLFWLHRWLGLVVGTAFCGIALTGAVLVWAPELREITQRQRIAPSAKPVAPITAFRDTIRREIPQGDLRTLTFRGPERTVEALVFVPGSHQHAQLDPTTAALVHVQDMRRGWLTGILHFHRELLLGKPGREITHLITLMFFIMMVSGIVLRRPFVRGKAHHPKAAPHRRTARWSLWWWHDWVGYHGSVLALCSVVTGLYWGFGFIKEATRFATGEAARVVVKPLSIVPANPDRTAAWRIMEDLAVRYRAELLAGHVRIAIPHKLDDPLSIVLNAHPGRAAKADHRYFDRYTGAPIEGEFDHDRLEENTAYRQIEALAYDVHFGTLMGLPGRILMCLSSLAAASLPITGAALWWRRRQRPKV